MNLNAKKLYRLPNQAIGSTRGCPDGRRRHLGWIPAGWSRRHRRLGPLMTTETSRKLMWGDGSTLR